MAGKAPVRTATVIDGIGINTHLNWGGSDSAYADRATVKDAIAYLNLRHLRDAVPTEGWTMPLYRELAALGVTFDIVTTGFEFSNNGDYALDLARIEEFLKTSPGGVSFIEGLNEINRFNVSYGGKNTSADISIGWTIQSILYDQVNSNALLENIPVINLTTGGLTAKQATPLGDMSAVADYGNWHVYFGNGEQPGRNIAVGIAAANVLAPSDPVIITEANYYTAVDAMEWGGGGVTETVQAKLDLNMIMDAMQSGAERIFLYELMDNSLKSGATETVEGSLGLFHGDGSPKLAATAIRNLTHILADDGADALSFKTGSLDYTLSGMPSNGRSLLMQESNGNYDIAVWAEPDIWDEKARAALAAPTASVTVHLGYVAGVVKAYDPLKGAKPIATYGNTDTIALDVSDHPLILEVSGVGKIPTTTTPVGAPKLAGLQQTIGAGADSLVIAVSQDAWNGAAQYQVFVDGRQIGGTLSAQASHGSGAVDALTVKGDWAAGTHTAEIRFINDAWGGTAETDRNLYVEGASYDGTAVVGAARALYSAGGAAFSFTDTTGGEQDFTVDATLALSGAAGSQRWGVIGVAARDWAGGAAMAVKTGDGIGVQGGRFDGQIDFNQNTGKTEAVTLDFGRGVDSATLRLGRMSASENGSPERAAWTAYAEDGSIVGTRLFDPREAASGSGTSYDFKIDPTADFTKLELGATGYSGAWSATDSSDFALARISFHAAQPVF